MRTENELMQLRRDKQLLQEQLRQRDELIAQLVQQLTTLSEQVQTLQAHSKKDSHNSHLPPSSDRFVRQPKSLRKPSGKKVGGQEGHQGSTLKMTATPDEVIVHRVEVCAQCEHDLRGMKSQQVERRQVIDVPPKQVVVIEYQAERNCCPMSERVKSCTRCWEPR
jgi:transposase